MLFRSVVLAGAFFQASAGEIPAPSQVNCDPIRPPSTNASLLRVRLEVEGVGVTGDGVIGLEGVEVGVVWADTAHPAKLSKLKPHRAATASE